MENFCSRFVGGSKAASNEANSNSQAKTAGTKIVTAEVRDVAKFIEATGTFQADESTDVAGETSGKVAQTFVSEGDFVKSGGVLTRLDERDANLRLQQARADESKARAALVQAGAGSATAGERRFG